MPKCENCGAEFAGNFCPVCGKAAGPAFCPNCGAKLDAGTKFCPNCGNPIAAAAPVHAQAQAPASLAQTEELQTELYSLYKVLEPVRELDLARREIDAKIAELNKAVPEVNNRFRYTYVWYAPFISTEIDENLLTPSNKKDAKIWKEFIKVQKEKLYDKKYDPAKARKYSIEDVYRIFKENEANVMKNLGASFLYYKMDFCVHKPGDITFYKGVIGGKKKQDCKLIYMSEFIGEFLQKKLGDNYYQYLIDVFTQLRGGNKGEIQLCDMPEAYATLNVGSRTTFETYFWGLPSVYKDLCNGIFNWDKVETEAKTSMGEVVHEKTELDGAVVELGKIRNEIDAATVEYMNQVDAYISQNVKIVPISYARNWEIVPYFLHLLVNKRGRDIYEVINQYEIDMKHQELTAALGDIRLEIRDQTQILGSKLDNINRSIVDMTDRITSAISAQTRALGKSLENINCSVISSGASVVGAISQLGTDLAKAMGNMQFNVKVS